MTEEQTLQRNTSPDCIKNFSKRNLNILEEDALRFGLNHHSLPKKFNSYDTKANLEQLIYSIKKNENITLNSEIKDEIKFVFKQFSNNAKRLCSNPKNSSFHRTLKQLSDDSSIKICKFDKGKGTAILNKKDYFLKLDDIVEDKSKFRKIKNKSKIHSIIRKEKSISYYIKKYLKNYDSEITNSLTPSGSQPGKLYGLIKFIKMSAHYDQWFL